MPLVVAHVAASMPEATVTVSALEAAGIPAFIFDERMMRAAPHLDTALGGRRIMVSDTDLEAARALLDAREPSTLEDESEAFRAHAGRGVLGLLVSFLAAWFPWWSRHRRFREAAPDDRRACDENGAGNDRG